MEANDTTMNVMLVLTVCVTCALITAKYGPESVRHSLQSSNLIIPEYESSKAVTCSSDCNPACNFTWWHRGTRVIDGSTFILTNVSKDQAETYVCNASNMIGSGMTEIKIDVSYPPKNTELKAKTNPVMENDSLDLLCKTDSFPTSNVSWMQGNTTLSYAAMADYHYIKHAKCWDTGTYTCKASNGHGEPVSKAIDIFVNCKPRLDHRIMTQQNIQTKYVKTGSYLMIKFHFIAYPAPKISWRFYRNGSGLESPLLISKPNIDVSEQNNLFMHTFRLFIPSIKDEDFGYYTIYVGNQYGRSTAQVHVVKKTSKSLIPERKEDILVQIQEFEMQQCDSVYQNNRRIMERKEEILVQSYDDLTEDDPIYNESKYGKMKEIKEKDETEECSSCENYIESVSICKADSDYSVQKLDTDQSKDGGDTTGKEDKKERKENENTNAPEYFEIIDIIKNEGINNVMMTVLKKKDNHQGLDILTLNTFIVHHMEFNQKE
ncbi:hypothetical protein KUTeg_020820 [Tegillarca granosa]|uniref:Ig-like domain-containing protein n=1 Tax=Tegillarca granosa TaxID=220873 RepID=A0ABQ9E920_TEGGR|nr:hypothetical protein KUTeg_020820 [Tegillarca granosa]